MVGKTEGVLVFLLLEEGLDEEEHGDRGQRQEDKEELKASLARVQLGGHHHVAGAHEHADEHLEKGRGGLLDQRATHRGVVVASVGVVGRGIQQLRVVGGVAFPDPDCGPRLRFTAHLKRLLEWQACGLLVAEPVGRGDGDDLLVVPDEALVIVGHPLGADHQAQVAENGVDKDHLGDEHIVERLLVVEEEAVGQLAAHANNHLRHTQDDRDLHLEGVVEVELVRGVGPAGINAPRVHNARVVSLLEGDVRVGRVFPLRITGLEGDGEGLVVDRSAVESEDAHHEDKIAALVDHADHLVELLLGELLLVQDEPQSRQRHDQPVSGIAEHDTEEEGEGDARKHSGVILLVVSNTVRFDERLEAVGKLVGPEVGWGLLLGLESVEHSGNQRAAGLLGTLQRLLDTFLLALGAPPRGDKALVGEIVVEHVEGVVDGLVATHHVEPRREGHKETRKHLIPMITSTIEDGREISLARSHFDLKSVLLLRVLGEGMAVSRERVADLGNLLLRTLTREENDEDRLEHGLS
mmetsp:Transcript_28541/g.67481  ORF Transcript_28541/g.67481 Transcript_28541/m.67481 type:complete len:523 (-) Transcript_28541:663-2231(-)